MVAVIMDGYANFFKFWMTYWGLYPSKVPEKKSQPKKHYWSWKCQKCGHTSGKMTLPPSANPPGDMICDVNRECEGQMVPYIYITPKEQ